MPNDMRHSSHCLWYLENAQNLKYISSRRAPPPHTLPPPPISPLILQETHLFSFSFFLFLQHHKFFPHSVHPCILSAEHRAWKNAALHKHLPDPRAHWPRSRGFVSEKLFVLILWSKRKKKKRHFTEFWIKPIPVIKTSVSVTFLCFVLAYH